MSTPVSDTVTQAPIYFPVSTVKLVCLSCCSFGGYEFYWFYKNWQLERDRQSEDLSPFWRTFFGVFFCYSLFRRITNTGVREGLFRGGGAGLLATLYVICRVSWRLPDPYSLVSVLGILPLVVAQQMVETINARLSPEAPRNSRFSVANIVLLVLGGPLFLYFVFSALIPDPWLS